MIYLPRAKPRALSAHVHQQQIDGDGCCLLLLLLLFPGATDAWMYALAVMALLDLLCSLHPLLATELAASM